MANGEEGTRRHISTFIYFSEYNQGSNNIVNAYKLLLGKDYEDIFIVFELIPATSGRQSMSHV